MTTNIQTLFPSFSSALLEDITANSMNCNFDSGTIMMKTGQYIKHIFNT